MSASPAADQWSVDGVDFTVATSWGMTVARGRFDRVAGFYDGTGLEVVVALDSVHTGNAWIDGRARSHERVAEDSLARFTSTRVHHAGNGRLLIEGEVDAGGEVVPVQLDAGLRGSGSGIELETSTMIDERMVGKRGDRLGMILPAWLELSVHLSSR